MEQNIKVITDFIFLSDKLSKSDLIIVPGTTRIDIVKKAFACQFCENPTCTKEFDIRGIMRRVCIGNFSGAKKIISKDPINCTKEMLLKYEKTCIEKKRIGKSVDIFKVVEFLKENKNE